MEPRVQRLRGRGEEVRALGTHLVEVDVHLRRRSRVAGDPGLRLGLGHPGPVPVEIETEVVGPAPRPRGMVLSRVGVRVGFAGDRGREPGQVPHPAVRIGHGIHRKHDAPQELHGLLVPRRGEVVQRRHRGVGARRLVPVDSVREPHENGEIGGHRRRFRGRW